MAIRKSSHDDTIGRGGQLSLLTDMPGEASNVQQSTLAQSSALAQPSSVPIQPSMPPAVAKARTRNSHGRIKRRFTDPMDKVRPDRDAFAQLLRQTDELVRDSLVRAKLFQRCEKQAGGMVTLIMQSVDRCLHSDIAVNLYNPGLDREATLREMTVELKTLATYVNAACQAKQISLHKCEVWQRQINGVDNLVVGLAIGLQRKRRESSHGENGTKPSWTQNPPVPKTDSEVGQ